MQTAPAVPLSVVVRRFWPYTRGARRWLPVTLVFLAMAPAVEAAEIWLFSRVVDDVLVPGRFSRFLPIAALYLAFAVVGGLVGFADSLLSAGLSQRFVLSLRCHVFRHLQRLGPEFFDRRQLGDLVSRLTGDVAAIESFLVSGFADALSYALRLVIFTVALFVLRWDLAVVSLAAVPLFFLTARRFSRLTRQVSREKRRRSGSIGAVAEESLGNIALVQAYGREDWEAHRFERESRAKFDAEMLSTRLRGVFAPISDLIELLGALLVLGLGAWEISRGRLTLGEMLVFLTFLARMYSPIRGLSKLVGSVYSASAGAERVLELLDAAPRVAQRGNARPLARARGVLELTAVTFRYPETLRPALRGVTLRVAPGETLALVGPSGAGKSTLGKLLLRYYDPTSGTVTLDGIDLRDLDLAALRANVAVVLQETLVFDGTVRDNIAYGRPDAAEAQIVAAARAADAHEFIEALPLGYDTVIGQRGRLLSGGQRQRIAIARATVRDAPVLLLDEPTIGLDAESGARVRAALRRLMAGRTTIVIGHSLLTVDGVTQVAYLEGGVVVESGTSEQLLATGSRYASLHARLTSALPSAGPLGTDPAAADPVPDGRVPPTAVVAG